MKHFEKISPLENRTFKFKNPAMQFFCPLCRTERAIVTNPHLTFKNYIQISLLTLMTTMALWPIMVWRSVFSFFVFWAGFEAFRRLSFRKEVPCPHCGFDASWYKKDVKVAKQLVHHFWEGQESDEEKTDGVESVNS